MKLRPIPALLGGETGEPDSPRSARASSTEVEITEGSPDTLAVKLTLVARE